MYASIQDRAGLVNFKASRGRLLKRAKVGHDLPALRLGQARPGRHSVAEIALAEKPLEVAVTGRLDPLAAKRGPFFSVTPSVCLVALQAVVAVKKCACRNRIWLCREGVGASVIPGRDMVPQLTCRRTHQEWHTQRNCQNRISRGMYPRPH